MVILKTSDGINSVKSNGITNGIISPPRTPLNSKTLTQSPSPKPLFSRLHSWKLTFCQP